MSGQRKGWEGVRARTMRMGGPCEVSFPGRERECAWRFPHIVRPVWLEDAEHRGESREKICGERGWCGQGRSLWHAKLDGKAIAESA